VFESKNALFRHLRETNGGCLTGDDYDNFVHYGAKEARTVKSIVLFGYLPSWLERKQRPKTTTAKISCGKDAADLLVQVISTANSERWTRSYGCASRGTVITQQDEGTGAITELLCLKLVPLLDPLTQDEWILQINDKLNHLLRDDDAEIRVLGRMDMPFAKFNAEMDVSHRRIDYLLPLDFFHDANQQALSKQAFFDSLPSFSAGYLSKEQKELQRPKPETLAYLHQLKRQRQLLTTPIVELDPNDTAAILEKEFHLKKRRRQKKNNSNKEGVAKRIDQEKDEKTFGPVTGNVLRRRRFHNFTPRGMAHEFLAFRRLDRFFHRATLRLHHGHPFLVLSLTGDLFLNGQAPRVVGLFLAITKGMIDEEIVECIYDEEYPHLVPTPPAPSFAMFSGEASYISWEGKAKAILTARNADRYPNGFSRQEVLDRTTAWEKVIHDKIANGWMKEGFDPDGRLVAERMWFEEVLQPWTKRAKEQLQDYRQWKAQNKSTTEQTETLPPLETVDQTIPKLYEKVLECLRNADASGNWPSTTPKRQLVMISTPNDENVADAPASLSMAHLKAKANNKAERSSAYAYAEGEGGASGSFSVGAMPGELCIQPKGNEMFPDLMKAAFELEIALCPNREPSSTIAINRNAQFRPHTDSGAGAGQSTSLIVALGTFVGGELVVEGEKKDIRYKAIEFNGWTQRHWTMPFKGERYSLVWFTPKGCEGIHGIDLCK